jgi:transposase
MLTVEHYGQIRRANRDGMSVRAIARTLHHSRRKVREALTRPEPRPYTRCKDPPAPRLGAFHAIIDAILTADEQAPRKQRHTMRQVFRRLGAEHDYPGGYDAVRRYIGKRRRRSRETFIPLAHDPGQRLECDFGHIYVDFPDGRRQVAVLIAAWAYSYCPFAIALPTERTEAILAGMVEAFEFFGAVPREVWWDNPTTVVAEIFKGRSRRPHPRYAALASHYNFDPLFCMPACGNEKPHVENRVYDLQRRWATPVPRMRDFSELNAYLCQCCLKDRQRTVAGRPQTIDERFEQDRAAALALPARRFDACIHQAALVDKYQMVRFDAVRYSVPRTWAFQAVTVKGYVDRVEVVAGDQVVARHARSYEHGEQVLDPIHYLVTLGRRPAALDHSNVYRQWRLPQDFTTLRKRLEARHGPATGARQYIRILQLLATHPVERIHTAIQRCNHLEDLHADRITQQVQRLADRDVPGADSSLSSDSLLSVQVPIPDLSRFDQLLSRGELAHA